MLIVGHQFGEILPQERSFGRWHAIIEVSRRAHEKEPRARYAGQAPSRIGTFFGAEAADLFGAFGRQYVRESGSGETVIAQKISRPMLSRVVKQRDVPWLKTGSQIINYRRTVIKTMARTTPNVAMQRDGK